MKLHVVLIIWLHICHSVLGVFDCGDCQCDYEYNRDPAANIRAICSGAMLTTFPTLDSAVAKRIYLLGLARNLISEMSKEYLDPFPNLLRVLDLRDQGSCVSFPAEFESKVNIYVEKCPSESKLDKEEKKDSILDGFKKHFVGFIPSEHQPPSLNATSNGTDLNSTFVPPDSGSVYFTSDKAKSIISLLERFRQALIAGGHTTLALIIYAIITTVGILSTLGYLLQKCCSKRRPRGRYTFSGVEMPLRQQNETSLTDSPDSWPEPPPPEPAVLNLESESSNGNSSSSSSDEVLFSKSCGVMCPRTSPAKEHEA